MARAWIGLAVLLVCACGQAPEIAPAPEPAAEAAAEPRPVSPIVSALRTASDARYHIEQSGFRDVANVGKNAEGRWAATATLAGRPVKVVIDDEGVVVIAPPDAPT